MRCIYRGKFSSREELATFCYKEEIPPDAILPSKAYSTRKWIARQTEFFKTSLNGNFPRYSSLPNIVNERINCKVLDFGGGSGWIKNLIPTNVEYLNFELENSINKLKKIHGSNVKFTSNLEEVYQFLPKIIYSNSTLQYLTNLETFLETVAIESTQLVVLDDLYLSEQETYFSLQEYYGDLIPTVFYNEEFLVKSILDFGYEIVESRAFPAKHSDSMLMAIDLLNGSTVEIPTPKTIVFRKY